VTIIENNACKIQIVFFALLCPVFIFHQVMFIYKYFLIALLFANSADSSGRGPPGRGGGRGRQQARPSEHSRRPDDSDLPTSRGGGQSARRAGIVLTRFASTRGVGSHAADDIPQEEPLTMQSLLEQRLASVESKDGNRGWATTTKPADIVAEYNNAIATVENLKSVRNSFKLALYSILCKSGQTGKVENKCPILTPESPAVRDMYDILKQVFPGDIATIEAARTGASVPVPEQPVDLMSSAPPISGGSDSSSRGPPGIDTPTTSDAAPPPPLLPIDPYVVVHDENAISWKPRPHGNPMSALKPDDDTKANSDLSKDPIGIAQVVAGWNRLINRQESIRVENKNMYHALVALSVFENAPIDLSAADHVCQEIALRSTVASHIRSGVGTCADIPIDPKLILLNRKMRELDPPAHTTIAAVIDAWNLYTRDSVAAISGIDNGRVARAMIQLGGIFGKRHFLPTVKSEDICAIVSPDPQDRQNFDDCPPVEADQAVANWWTMRQAGIENISTILPAAVGHATTITTGLHATQSLLLAFRSVNVADWDNSHILKLESDPVTIDSIIETWNILVNRQRDLHIVNRNMYFGLTALAQFQIAPLHAQKDADTVCQDFLSLYPIERAAGIVKDQSGMTCADKAITDQEDDITIKLTKRYRSMVELFFQWMPRIQSPMDKRIPSTDMEVVVTVWNEFVADPNKLLDIKDEGVALAYLDRSTKVSAQNNPLVLFAVLKLNRLFKNIQPKPRLPTENIDGPIKTHLCAFSADVGIKQQFGCPILKKADGKRFSSHDAHIPKDIMTKVWEDYEAAIAFLESI
jgi:hypothetical protein